MPTTARNVSREAGCRHVHDAGHRTASGFPCPSTSLPAPREHTRRLARRPVVLLTRARGFTAAARGPLVALRDELGLVEDASETAALAASLDDNGGVYLVPAFTGLGAPWWDSEARGLLCGLTRGTGRAQLARAALESIAYQTFDLFTLLRDAAGHDVDHLRVDGGAARNDWLMQFQADMLGIDIERGEDLETTCRGAALLAGVGCGVVTDPRRVGALSEGHATFSPRMDGARREERIAGWHAAVGRASTGR